MAPKICCLIGHEDLRDYNTEKMKIEIEKQINQLVEKGINYFITSCRLGFETLAALKVVEMRSKTHYDSNLLIMSLFEEEKRKVWFKNWSKKDLETYEFIKKNIYEEYNVTGETKGTLLSQHKSMIDISTYVLAAFDEKNLGATKAAINYAIKQNKKIIYLDMENLLRNFKKISIEDNWKTRKNYILDYSVDFSREKLDDLLDKHNIEFPLEVDNETYSNSIDPKKEEDFKLAKNILYSIAEETNSKINVMQVQAIPYQIMELENKKLDFTNSRKRRLLVDLINRADKFTIKNKGNGNIAINAQFDVQKYNI